MHPAFRPNLLKAVKHVPGTNCIMPKYHLVTFVFLGKKYYIIPRNIKDQPRRFAYEGKSSSRLG